MGTGLSQPVIAMLYTMTITFSCMLAPCQRSSTACCTGYWHSNSHVHKQKSSSSLPVVVSHHWCAGGRQSCRVYVAISNGCSSTTAGSFQLVLLCEGCPSFQELICHTSVAEMLWRNKAVAPTENQTPQPQLSYFAYKQNQHIQSLRPFAVVFSGAWLCFPDRGEAGPHWGPLSL